VGTVLRCVATTVALYLWLPSACSGQSVESAAYQYAEQFFAQYSKKHRELEHGAIAQPYSTLLIGYKDILAATDAKQLLSVVPVLVYEFPIVVDGGLKRVIGVRTDPSTGMLYDDPWMGIGTHSVSLADSTVFRLSQKMRLRKIIRFHLDDTGRSLIVLINERGDTLITPCELDGARIIGAKANSSGEYPLMSLNEAMPLLKAYAETTRGNYERWRK